MKHVMTKSVLAAALFGAASLAQAEFETSANVALTTDYVWRGVSQSDEDPAIQGGFDLSHDSGFYAGVWASNVDWDTAEPDMELDLYAGISGEFSNGLGWDVGVLAYTYDDSDGVNNNDSWTEVYGSLSYAFNDMVSANLYVGHSGDYLLTNKSGTYVSVGADVALPNDFGLSLSVGHTNMDQAQATYADYTDYKVALSKSLGGFDFELAYTDTNDPDRNGDGVGDYQNAGGNWADGRAFLSVSKSF